MKSETGIERVTRRQHDRTFKEELVRQSLQPGASVSAIALRAGINANMLFTWRRKHLRTPASPTAAAPAQLVPVHVVEEDVASAQMLPVTPTSPARVSRTSVIELEFAGAQLRLKGGVDEQMLASVLRALRQSA